MIYVILKSYKIRHACGRSIISAGGILAGHFVKGMQDNCLPSAGRLYPVSEPGYWPGLFIEFFSPVLKKRVGGPHVPKTEHSGP